MHYTRDVNDIEPTTEETVSLRSKLDHPSGYLPDQGLVDAVNVALILNKPLLVTGDPGTGKTQLAHSIAWQLASRHRLNVTTAEVEKFEAKSTSAARDLFYTFDAIRRFQAAQNPGRGDANGNLGNAPFISYNALGRAVMRALPPERVPQQLQTEVLYNSAARTVVLIDEIDKAPRDFPNDLLNEIEQMYFRIPELDNIQVGGPAAIASDYRPIVVITSNSEKNLPDPFLRRCVYYHIPFPTTERLREILLSRLGQLPSTQGPLIQDALAFFARLRDRKVLKRQTSPAELIDWLTYMLRRGAKPKHRLNDVRSYAFASLSALTKDPKDQDSIRTELESFLEEA
jgi:MoxR-like ATPase